jgi:DNA-binding PadR family transcriptional regulator
MFPVTFTDAGGNTAEMLGAALANTNQVICKDDMIDPCEWTPSPGSMYPALEALETKGFISCQGDGRRKVYSLTPKGQNVLDEIKKKRDEQFLEIKAFMSALFGE